MSNLDQKIDEALAKLLVDGKASEFDPEGYAAAFKISAQEKARDVLKYLGQVDQFATKKPFFVSIGGGDGEELDYLLRHSTGTEGVLIEIVEPIAQLARNREKPDGKSFEVIAKPAQAALPEAMGIALEAVKSGRAEAIVVTGHAVFHELYDRGTSQTGFDVIELFGHIFPDPEIHTFFTYREPGAEEKWPSEVVVSADCTGSSLLKLAAAIIARHPSFGDLLPRPCVLGDGIRVHKDLGLEVLTKLFYLSDLKHEIQERVTVINHANLQSAVYLAIGDTARSEYRCGMRTYSAPTLSFVKHWEMLKVRVSAVGSDFSTHQLAPAEAQTRVVAWRFPKAPLPEPSPPMPADVATAEQAWLLKDESLLQALLLSRARTWVEGDRASLGAALLHKIAANASPESFAALWSRYLLHIQSLFSGDYSGLGFFQRSQDAQSVGLGVLFRAEEMEFLRKTENRPDALKIANELASLMQHRITVASELEDYAVGTTGLLLSNFFRSGGRYEEARKFIGVSEEVLKPNIPSHATELAHCFYAKQVCAAMTGRKDFASVGYETNQEFAAGLIQVSYSHAAWFIDDLGRAIRHARVAAEYFNQIGNEKYAQRAMSLLSLLTIWKDLGEGRAPRYDNLPPELAGGVAELLGGTNLGSVSGWIATLRPSLALGILQLGKKICPAYNEPLEVSLPPVLHWSGTEWEWKMNLRAPSLAEADKLLRKELEIPEDRRLPLIAD